MTRQRRREKRARLIDRVKKRGPGALSEKQPVNKVLSAEELSDFGDFWRGVWGISGEHSLSHPAVRDWKRQMVANNPKCNPNREIAWRATIKKMAGLKAPGLDGIKGVWWKEFSWAAEILKEMIWVMIDG